MDKNKELCELLGICWHEIKIVDGKYVCSCGKIAGMLFDSCEFSNPYFTTPSGMVQLLGIMRERDDWPEFVEEKIGASVYQRNRGWIVTINLDYIFDTTGKLRDAAIEFLKITNK